MCACLIRLHFFTIKTLKGNNQYLKFFHRDSNKVKIACKTNTACWMWWSISNHAQTYLDLSGLNLIGLGSDLATLEVSQSDRLIEFKFKCLFIIYYTNLQMIEWNVFLLSQIAGFFGHQYLWKEAISTFTGLPKNDSI